MKLPIVMSRRRFLGGVCFAAAGSFAYARWIEPGWLQITQSTVALSPGGGRPPLKLLHLSDLHASEYVSLRTIDAALKAGLRLQPDLICITGDFITNEWEQQREYADILRQLSNAAPTFAVLGNHDGGAWSARHGGHDDVTWTASLLRDSGVTLLENHCGLVEARGWKLNIAGSGDSWAGTLDARATFAAQDPRYQTILLSHNPDSKTDFQPYPWDLMLCGHTHGGQLRIPLVGAPFAPVQDKRFLAGLYHWNQRRLHITRGVGNVLGMRVNCRPEISLLTLT